MRALHWVIKTPDRTSLVDFLHNTLGMHALRHEEFGEACKASCNGQDTSGNPYQGSWSKTMMGYGPEDSNFVLEITYTYNIKTYEFGNDLAWIKIRSRSVFNTLSEGITGVQVTEVPNSMRTLVATSPVEGFSFRVIGEDCDPDVGPISSICLHVSSLSKSLEAWVDGLGLLEVDHGFGEDHGIAATAPVESEDNRPDESWTSLSCGAKHATIRLKELPKGQALRRGTGYGRLAFSVPTEQLNDVADRCLQHGFKIHTSLVTLETPGKADVDVVILSDPDGHEVCLVGEEGFVELSKVDETAPQLLGEAIARDGSNDWFRKKLN